MLRSGKFAVFVMLLVGLGACTSPAERPGAQAGIATDEFSKNIDVIGLLQVHNPFFDIKDFYRLVTHIDKQTHAFTHAIELQIAYDGKFFYFEYAADDAARSLRLVPVKRERNTLIGDRVENFDIIVPEASLRSHAATGYRVKISARDGTYYIIEVSPQMIAAQYEGMTKVLGPSVALQLGPPPAALVAGGSAAPAAAPNSRTADGKGHLGIVPFDLLFGVGIQVNRVDPNTPAAAAGFQIGDLVRKYNGEPIKDAQDLINHIQQTAPGRVVPVEITRHQQTMTLSVQM